MLFKQEANAFCLTTKLLYVHKAVKVNQLYLTTLHILIHVLSLKHNCKMRKFAAYIFEHKLEVSIRWPD